MIDADLLREILKEYENAKFGYTAAKLETYRKHVGALLAERLAVIEARDNADAALKASGKACSDLAEKVAKLQAFKDWVHGYLDAKGVPADPGGPHSKEGCRIGDRMDWVFIQLGQLAGRSATDAKVFAVISKYLPELTKPEPSPTLPMDLCNDLMMAIGLTPAYEKI